MSKNKSNKKNKNAYTPQKGENPVLQKLKEENKIKQEEAILNDEAVKKKLEELDKQKQELKEKTALVEQREIKVQDMERVLATQRAQVAAEVEAEIRENEKAIRAEEYAELQKRWEQERIEALAKVTDEIAAEKQAAADEYSIAHTKRIEAENEKQACIRESEKLIEEKHAELTEEYERKIEALNRARTECAELKAEIEIERSDLEEEQAYIKTLRKKYEGASETEVLRLRQTVEHLETVNQVSQENLTELSEKLAKLQNKLIQHNGKSEQERIDELEHQLERARQQLDEYVNLPSPERVAELELAENELARSRDEVDETRRKYFKTKEQLDATLLSVRELENAKATSAALTALNDQLQKKLQYISEQYKSTQESKFQGLLEIDASNNETPFDRKEFSGTLSDLVQYVRYYGAYSREDDPLYYSEDTIRVFISSLAASDPASRLIILQGLSGTGKSSLPALFGDALQLHVDFISVQPSWRDNRELLGYDNDFTNRFKETEFTKSVYRASTGGAQNQITIIVLDEMNLARIEYYFADFLSVLEHQNSAWLIPLVSSYSEVDIEKQPRALNYENGTASLVVTKNIWFVGTANNDDSTSLITDKVYDRAQIIDMDAREPEFPIKEVRPMYLDLPMLQELFENAKRDPEGQMDDDDWDNLDLIDEYLKKMDITFGNRMKNQLNEFVPVYCACGGRKEDAIDYYLAHKILRKLDEKYDRYLLNCLNELNDGLNDIYGEDFFEQSRKKIENIKRRNFNEA